MIEISREEFVKRCLGDIDIKSDWLKCLFSLFFYERIESKTMVLLDREKWEKVKTLIENCPFLKNRGMETTETVLEHLRNDIIPRGLATKDEIELIEWFEELRKIVKN